MHSCWLKDRESHKAPESWELTPENSQHVSRNLGFPGGPDSLQSRICLQCRRPGFNPWVGRSLGEGNSNSLQYSCLENSMDRGAWQSTVHGVTELDTTEWLTQTHTEAETSVLQPQKTEFCQQLKNAWRWVFHQCLQMRTQPIQHLVFSFVLPQSENPAMPCVWSGHPRWLFSCSLHISYLTSPCSTYILLTWLTYVLNHRA